MKVLISLLGLIKTKSYEEIGIKRGNYLKSLWMKGTKKLSEHSKLNRYVSALTEVFVNEKRINVYEHTGKMVPHVFI